ncbi:MAG: sensor histidine kinase, partial [Clostridia bacterium]|nr:sensor histidine kinase [Clostridia bacterium]
IAENSVKAQATLVHILLEETDDTLTVSIQDNGCGMTPEFARQVTDPFCTSRTTRKVGLGIPLLLLAARQTGGDVEVVSKTREMDEKNHGTLTKALFYKNHIDFTPLGDITETVCTLIQCNPDIDFEYRHTMGKKEVTLSTREMREQLGGVPLNTYEVIVWIREYLTEQYNAFI